MGDAGRNTTAASAGEGRGILQKGGSDTAPCGSDMAGSPDTVMVTPGRGGGWTQGWVRVVQGGVLLMPAGFKYYRLEEAV